MPTPSLTPLPPLPGMPLRFPAKGAITIGTAANLSRRVDAAGVAPRHAKVEFRDGGWWIIPIDGLVEVNGAPIADATRLKDQDQLRFAPNVFFEFASGERRTRRMVSAADMIARPRKARSGRLPGPARKTSIAALGTVALAVLLVAGAGAVVWYTLFRATKSIAVLSDRQAGELDSLLSVAYDHVERGGTLLELGLGDGASDEFAKAVTTLELSDLRNHPLVKPRIQALAASVAAIYRERSLAVPSNYANATSPLTPEQLKTASLTVDEFAAKFGLMQATFEARFGHPIIVTGRDHAEHVFLYGKGGAMDLSIKNMTPDEVAWVVDRAHAEHIRVKDFSRDSVLRRQVANAIKAGLLFEAGTGLHVHIDRFANRRDRWTTLRTPGSPERSRDLAQRWAPGGILAPRRDDGL
jgi:hypothetical protein